MANTTRSNYIPGMIDCERAILDSVFDKNSTFFPLYRKQIEKKKEKNRRKSKKEPRKGANSHCSNCYSQKKGSDCNKKKKHTYIAVLFSSATIFSTPPLSWNRRVGTDASLPVHDS
jgi:hypothetical protein